MTYAFESLLCSLLTFKLELSEFHIQIKFAQCWISC